MTRGRLILVAMAFLAGFFLVGLSYWDAPSSQGAVLDEDTAPGLIAAAAVAMMLVVGRVTSFHVAWAVMALCFPFAAAYRIAAEMRVDPASHALWPVELVIALIVGGAIILPGVLIGALTRRLQSLSRDR